MSGLITVLNDLRDDLQRLFDEIKDMEQPRIDVYVYEGEPDGTVNEG